MFQILVNSKRRCSDIGAYCLRLGQWRGLRGNLWLQRRTGWGGRPIWKHLAALAFNRHQVAFSAHSVASVLGMMKGATVNGHVGNVIRTVRTLAYPIPYTGAKPKH